MAGRPGRRARLEAIARGEPDPYAFKAVPEPYQPTHGAETRGIYEPLAEQIRTDVLIQRPDLADPQYKDALEAWSISEARCRLYRSYAEKVGEFDDEGNPRPFANAWTRQERVTSDLRKRLGLDPMANIQLAKDRATVAVLGFDFHEIVDQGREVLQRRRPGAELPSSAAPDTGGENFPSATSSIPAGGQNSFPAGLGSPDGVGPDIAGAGNSDVPQSDGGE